MHSAASRNLCQIRSQAARAAAYAALLLCGKKEAREAVTDRTSLILIIRSTQYGPLSSGAPDRGLSWGVIRLPHKLDLVPILDVHTGFPFSRLDQNWNRLGPENHAGRSPTFLALDTRLQYPVDFKFHGHRIQFRAGLTVYNVLNHSNPRDVQQYYASSLYGTFYNSVPRLWRMDGDFEI